MQDSASAGSQHLGWKAPLVNAARFWEPRRLIYNALLVAATAGWVVFTWPLFRPGLTWSSLLPMTGLALVANLCYCAAYLVDIPLQLSSFSDAWKRHRWMLFMAGTIFALVLASYWINDEIAADFIR